MKISNLEQLLSSKLHITILTAVFTFGMISYTGASVTELSDPTPATVKVDDISVNEVEAAQIAWGEGIVKIGKVFMDKGDYKQAAIDHINKFYNYQEGEVLFKPTLAAEKQFRLDFEGALSYFVGGNKKYAEDGGFAIKPWTNVRWENIGTKIDGNMAVAMGNYYFTPADGSADVKVEYSFAYTKDANGNLKIVLHSSHIPFQG
ncbi:MAG: phosphoribosyl-AMP cyclohydrolase [Balneola sp.]|nr:MAG: phosphoribosyl-AMP cyclohydrolase [Balneola sp.]